MSSARVIVASTRAATGVYPDRTGPIIVEWLTGRGYEVPAPVVVPDGEPVGAALRDAVHEYFAHRAQVMRQRLRELFRVGRISLLIGIVTLAVLFVLSDLIGGLLPSARIREPRLGPIRHWRRDRASLR